MYKDKLKDLRINIKNAYGKNIELLRVIQDDNGESWFVLNDILEFLYKFKRQPERRGIIKSNILKHIILGKFEKKKVLSFGGYQDTILINQLALLEILAYQNNIEIKT